MFDTSITFDELPDAVSSLVNLVRELANEVRELRTQLTSERNNTKSNSRFIGIPEACEILGKAKSTVYRLANEGKVPAYKVPGEKEWRFIESELVAHVKENKRQSSILSFAEMEAEISRGTRANSLWRCLLTRCSYSAKPSTSRANESRVELAPTMPSAAEIGVKLK